MNQPEPLTLSGERTSRIAGALLALAGFATALLVGLVVSNPGPTAIARALGCMIACLFIGRALGWAGGIATGEFIRAYQKDHPPPRPPHELVRLKNRHDRHKQIADELARTS